LGITGIIICFLFASVFLAGGLYTIGNSFKYRKFIPVKGEIIQSKIYEDFIDYSMGVKYSARIDYEFEYKRTRYNACKLYAGANIFKTLIEMWIPGKRQAQKEMVAYPCGKAVTVYVNPDKPTDACLQKKGMGGAFVYLAWGYLFIHFAIIMLNNLI
jgi:hypothetical protein